MYVWASTDMAMDNLALAMPNTRLGDPATTKLLTGRPLKTSLIPGSAPRIHDIPDEDLPLPQEARQLLPILNAIITPTILYTR